MRVLVDGRKILDGGIGVYIRHLLEGLVLLGQDEVAVIASPESLQNPLVAGQEWLKRVEVLADDAKPYSLDEFLRLSSRIDFTRFDLFHEPHYTLPYGVPIPSVLTVHDLIHITHPEKPYYPLVARPLIRSGLQRANEVIAVSAATAREVTALFGSRLGLEEKLTVIPNSLGAQFRTVLGSDGGTESEVRNQSNTKRFGGPYLLSMLSNLKPHKGLADLLQAFERMKSFAHDSAVDSQIRKFIGDCKLVLIGKGTEGMVSENALLNRAGSVRDVFIHGGVSAEELIDLYRGALGVVVPSVAEGFCLTILETHACERPVVARPVPAVQEILLPCDSCAEDLSLESFIGALIDFVTHRAKSVPLSTEGRESYFRRFDLIQVTEQIRTVYQRALQSQATEVAA